MWNPKWSPTTSSRHGCDPHYRDLTPASSTGGPVHVAVDTPSHRRDSCPTGGPVGVLFYYSAPLGTCRIEVQVDDLWVQVSEWRTVSPFRRNQRREVETTRTKCQTLHWLSCRLVVPVVTVLPRDSGPLWVGVLEVDPFLFHLGCCRKWTHEYRRTVSFRSGVWLLYVPSNPILLTLVDFPFIEVLLSNAKKIRCLIFVTSARVGLPQELSLLSCSFPVLSDEIRFTPTCPRGNFPKILKRPKTRRPTIILGSSSVGGTSCTPS